MGKEANYLRAKGLLDVFKKDRSCIDCTTALPLQPPIKVDVDPVRATGLYPDYGPLTLASVAFFTRHGVRCNTDNIHLSPSTFVIIEKTLEGINKRIRNPKILIPTPSYGYYLEVIPDSYNKVYFSSKSKDHQLDAYELAEHLSHLKEEDLPNVLLIQNPINPTGQILTDDQLKALAKVCNERKIFVYSDEIFVDTLIHKTEIASLASFMNPKLIVSSSGIGKAYGLPGARASIAESAEENIDELFHQNLTGLVSSYGNECAAKILGKDYINQRKQYRINNTTIFHDSVSKINTSLRSINILLSVKHNGGRYQEYFHMIEPESTTVALVDMSKLKDVEIFGKKHQTGLELAQSFYDFANLALVPGEAFMLEPESMTCRVPLSPRSPILEGLDALKTAVLKSQNIAKDLCMQAKL